MKVPITRLGYRRLLAQLVHLRREVRPQVLEELAEARIYGVKVENQQYLMARERHVILQKKIQDLEDKLSRCEVFAGRRFLTREAGFGIFAVIENVETGDIHQYQLVGPFESDVRNGKLSIDSPVGRGLVGHYEGDEVTVYTPTGIRIYRILSIRD